MLGVFIAFADTAVATKLQKALETINIQASLAYPTDRIPTYVEAVVLMGDGNESELPIEIDIWRDRTTPIGIVVLGGSQKTKEISIEKHVYHIPQDTTITALQDVIDHSVLYRHSYTTNQSIANEILCLQPPASSVQEAIPHLGNGDIRLMQEALRWHAPHYITASTQLLLLQIDGVVPPQNIAVCQFLDGSKTLRTVLQQNVVSPEETIPFLWLLGCFGIVAFTQSPIDEQTIERRETAQLRRHIAQRYHHYYPPQENKHQTKTHYDVLETSRFATDQEIANAFRELSMRFGPPVVGEIDLGNYSKLMATLWQDITAAHQALDTKEKRRRYAAKAALQKRPITTDFTLSLDSIQTARTRFSSGQKALSSGSIHKAISDFAMACRQHPNHPVYETALSWTKYLVDAQSGNPPHATAKAKRANAEKALLGRRPWPQAILTLARLCAAEGDIEAATFHTCEALRVAPHFQIAHTFLQQLQTLQKDPPEETAT